MRKGGIVDVIARSPDCANDRLRIGGKRQRLFHAEGELLHVFPPRPTIDGGNIGPGWIGANGVMTVLKTQE